MGVSLYDDSGLRHQAEMCSAPEFLELFSTGIMKIRMVTICCIGRPVREIPVVVILIEFEFRK